MEEKIKKIVQMALEEVNEDADEVIEYGENAALFGKGEGMDSFSFVTLISNIEEQIQEQFGKEVYLVSDQVYEKKYNPFGNDRIAGEIYSRTSAGGSISGICSFRRYWYNRYRGGSTEECNK